MEITKRSKSCFKYALLFCFRKSAKGALVLMPSLGFIYLVTFYTPVGNVKFDLFVRILYPMQVRYKPIRLFCFLVYITMECDRLAGTN